MIFGRGKKKRKEGLEKAEEKWLLERDKERVWLGFGSRSLVPKTFDVHIISDVRGRFNLSAWVSF